MELTKIQSQEISTIRKMLNISKIENLVEGGGIESKRTEKIKKWFNLAR